MFLHSPSRLHKYVDESCKTKAGNSCPNSLTLIALHRRITYDTATYHETNISESK